MDEGSTSLFGKNAAPPPGTPCILMGREGLRAGWGLLLYLILMFFFAVGSGAVVREIWRLPDRITSAPAVIPPSPGVIINYCTLVAVAILVAWLMSKIERRPVGAYGLGGDRKFSRFVAGFLWGLACLSLLALFLVKRGFLAIDGRELFGRDVLTYGVFWLFFFLLVGVFEEYTTRGYLQYTLARGLAGIYKAAFETPDSAALGFWSSAVVISVLFALIHTTNHGESPIGLLAAGLVSLVFCLSLWRTGSLWWAIGFHAAWDWSQSFLYGVADSGTISQDHLLNSHPAGKPILSGGTTGPEGSIFVLAVLAMVCVIIFATLRRSSLSNAVQRSSER